MNIYSWIDEHAKRLPKKAAIKTKDGSISYAELKRMSSSMADSMKDAGIKKGDNVTAMLPNIIELVVSFMACAKIGAVIVPVNPTYTSRELSHILSDSESKGLVIEHESCGAFDEIKDKFSLNFVVTTGEHGNFGYWAEHAGSEGFEEMEADDTVCMIYSAGLTGIPMGAMLTCKNLYHQSSLMHDEMDCGEKDTTLTIIPLFHSFSISTNMLSMLRYGGTVYLMKKPDFKEISKVLKAKIITIIDAVPTLFFGLTYHPDLQDADYSSVHTMIAGGSALPLEVYNDFKKKFGKDILHGYGITEASPVCSVNPKKGPIKPASIGRTVSGVSVQVLDENGKKLGFNAIGELFFKGPNIMKGYYKKPMETANTIKDGWLCTGDIGYTDEDGYIYITGYKKQMIITSGFNVYNRDVEGVLASIPGVSDVAITGVNDLMRGAIIKAYIVRNDPTLTENDIKMKARKILAPYKTPRKIVLVNEIPRDATGKALIENINEP